LFKNKRMGPAEKRDDAETQRRSGFVTRSQSARQHLDAADGHLVRRQLQQAAAQYKNALHQSGDADLGVRIEALYGMGSVYRVHGVVETAIGFYNQVLALEPAHSPALHSLIHMYVSLSQWEDVENCELRLLNAIVDPRERIDELIASGDRWWRAANKPKRAERRYQQANNLDEDNEAVIRRLAELARLEPPETSAKQREMIELGPTPAVCPNVPIQLRVDERIVDQIDAIAKAKGKTRSTIMMLALLHYIEQQREPPVSCE
jgi:tetratricopeptide (TPR) repeat protein